MHVLSRRFSVTEDALKSLTGVEAEFLSDYIRKTTHHSVTSTGIYHGFSQSLCVCRLMVLKLKFKEICFYYQMDSE